MAKAKPLALNTEDRELLEALIRTRTIQASIMNRARIILLKADGESIDSIADKVGLNRNSVLLCLRKFKEGGVSNAIYDAPGRGRVYCIIKVPKVAEQNPQSCMRNFPIIASDVWYFPKPIYPI